MTYATRYVAYHENLSLLGYVVILSMHVNIIKRLFGQKNKNGHKFHFLHEMYEGVGNTFFYTRVCVFCAVKVFVEKNQADLYFLSGTNALTE